MTPSTALPDCLRSLARSARDDVALAGARGGDWAAVYQPTADLLAAGLPEPLVRPRASRAALHAAHETACRAIRRPTPPAERIAPVHLSTGFVRRRNGCIAPVDCAAANSRSVWRRWASARDSARQKSGQSCMPPLQRRRRWRRSRNEATAKRLLSTVALLRWMHPQHPLSIRR